MSKFSIEEVVDLMEGCTEKMCFAEKRFQKTGNIIYKQEARRWLRLREKVHAKQVAGEL